MKYYICEPQELYHHGIKGMKWGIRKKRELKRKFRKDEKKLRNKYIAEEWAKQDVHNYRSKLDAMDEAERKKHSGYEYGDLYTPDWEKSKNKKVREYSFMTDKVYGDNGIEESVYHVAGKRVAAELTKKYGGSNWKDVKKAQKRQLASKKR